MSMKLYHIIDILLWKQLSFFLFFFFFFFFFFLWSGQTMIQHILQCELHQKVFLKTICNHWNHVIIVSSWMQLFITCMIYKSHNNKHVSPCLYDSAHKKKKKKKKKKYIYFFFLYHSKSMATASDIAVVFVIYIPLWPIAPVFPTPLL